jgi:mannose-6-phosphate isomerase
MNYPLTFEYHGMYQSYLWGGRSLAALVGAPAGEPVAELWAVSDRPEQGKQSRIANGPLAGRTLAEIVAADPRGVLGFDPPDHRFPLLVKILDARQSLSVQVHPPPAVARQLGGQPKAEAWLFLEGSQPGSTVYAGFERDVTQSHFVAALEHGSIESILHRVPAEPGTLVDIPAGRIHAINPGCLILEVQQNSDTTYRVYDYNRVDPRTGKARRLHVEQSLASIDFTDDEPGPTEPRRVDDPRGDRAILLETDHFSLERFTGVGALRESTNGVATVIVNVKPNTILTVSVGGVATHQSRFECSLIPATVERFTINGNDLDYVLIRPTKPGRKLPTMVNRR